MLLAFFSMRMTSCSH